MKESARPLSDSAVQITIPFLRDDQHFNHELSLGEFTGLIAPDLDEAVLPITEAMRKAGLRKGELGRVILAGGSSQLPGVRERVWKETGVEPVEIPSNLMYAVAYGAALYHRRILQLPSDRREDRILGDGLGILVRDGGSVLFRIMLPHHSKLPASYEHAFSVPEGQDVITIDLRRGESTEPGLTTPLRSRNLSLRKRHTGKVVVRLEVDRNRIIKLRAFDPEDSTTEISMEVDDILGEQEITAMRRKLGIKLPDASLEVNVTPGVQPCIGIDVGTTSSEIAYVAVAGQSDPECLRNPNAVYSYDTRCYPSIVYFANGSRDPEVANTAALDAADDLNKQGLVFESFKTADWTKALGVFPDREVTAGELTAHLIARIWKDAVTEFGRIAELKSAVVTVPTAFGPDECLEMYNAAQLAGIQQPVFIDEPTAAFLYYQHKYPDVADNSIGNILIFDFGGGTADVAILDVSEDPGIAPRHFRHSLFSVKATAGNPRCGGRQIDARLARYLETIFVDRTGHSLDGAPAARSRLKQRAAEAKVKLSNLAMME